MNEKQTTLFHLFLIGIIGLLFVSNAITIFLFFQKEETEIIPVASETVPVEVAPITEESLPEEQVVNTEYLAPLESDNTVGEITVEWNDWPVEHTMSNLLGSEKYNNLEKKLDVSPGLTNVSVSGGKYLEDFEVYEVGKISSGSYKDSSIFIIKTQGYEMGWNGSFLRVIKTADQLIALQKYSQDITGIDATVFISNTNIKISNLETPETIKIPNTQYDLIKIEKEPYQLISKIGKLEKMFLSNNGQYVYKDPNSGCFILRAPDGTIREYLIDLTFVPTPKSNITDFVGITPVLPDITWNDGSKNKDEYIFRYEGPCGPHGCYVYAKYLTKDSDLEKTGSASNGDPIYILKNTALKRNEESQKNIFEEAYEEYYPGYDSKTSEMKEKISFEEFFTKKPFLYWKDPFGDYIEFKNAQFLSAVECGKPVIYLYPQKEMDVRVEVAPNGGFTKTEPAYNKGWFVKATPEGRLYNYADKKMYPYLFWEGRALNYKISQKGFVVRESEVASFLDKKLTLLGLKEKEKADFLEFWLPKFHGHPYYFVSFLPQEQFDALAPLSVFPRPQTVIRVFMDFYGLEKSISVREPNIRTPMRKGFTVVEWGGALHEL